MARNHADALPRRGSWKWILCGQGINLIDLRCSDELNKQAETDSIRPEESQKPSQTKEALVEPTLAPADETELPDTVTK